MANTPTVKPLRATGEIAPGRIYQDVPLPLLDDEGAGKLLGDISVGQVEKLRIHCGLPAINLGSGTIDDGRAAPSRRALWRYDPVALRDWWRKRQATGGTI